ncbi:hypothetical protein PTH_2081 [Pelotomaculum thermopropionicum SI]|uniref:Flagellar operon protein n=1 Tax=Pelotomaculum thermopropionicum (strain DSM 13744 / JCM 10971 / SI) TaxID=370438 RepID=A5D0I7_PELTS|nr:hypothetical protein PTH_2081 [Pelotomaculum thermopropionicum SI]
MVKGVSRIQGAGPVQAPPAAGRKEPALKSGLSFESILKKEFEKSRELKFSAHAERRLKERNIHLDGADLARIEGAFRQAEAKGARESLIIYGDLALVTSIKNRTVVTAMDGKSAQGHVFTNIDSAVIVNRLGE